MRIYIDESGAITKNYMKHNQRYFIIAQVMTKNCKELHRCFKDARLKAIIDQPRLVKKLEKTNEVKGSSLNEGRKAGIYEELLALHQSNEDFEIGISVVDNTKMKPSFFENKARSFNYLLFTSIKWFKEISILGSATNHLSLLIDDQNVSPTSKSTLQDQLNTQFRMVDEVFNEEIRVSYYDSQHETLIQLADIVANTVSRALNQASDEAKHNLSLLQPLLTNGQILKI